MKKIALWIGAVILVLVIGWLLFGAGVAVAPTDGGQNSTADTIMYENASDDLIKIELPFPGAVVGREFTARGEARGTWYFEASFPVAVVDPDGNQIATGIAQAEGDWMTENFVRFSAPLSVPVTYSGPARIVFMKDNPSGLPEHEARAWFEITVAE